MRIIVSDTSCMIDLRKAELLDALLGLPYTFAMPNTLFEDEWLCLDDGEKAKLRDRGLEVHNLSGRAVQVAADHFNRHRRLKLNDCFALTLTQELDDSMLLTGDGLLRRVAEEQGVEVRGVLWATDQMEEHGTASNRRLYDALQLFHDDAMVFLPTREIARRIRRLAQLL